MSVRQNSLGIILENKVVRKLSLKQKMVSQIDILRWFFLIRLILDIENWLWKYNFGTFWQTVSHWRILKKKSFEYVDLAKNLAFSDPPTLKFHNLTDIIIWTIYVNLLGRGHEKIVNWRRQHKNNSSSYQKVWPPWQNAELFFG